MKLCLIEPTNNIGNASEILTDTLIIPQFIKDWKKVEQYQTVFIDNGIFEIFHSNNLQINNPDDYILQLFFNLQDLTASLRTKAYLILPDIPFNYKKTKQLSEEALEGQIINRLIGVVQGKTTDEIIKICEFYFHNDIPIIAIPIKLRSYFRQTGIDITQFIYNNTPYDYNEIHQLGFELDDIQSEHFWKCRSFDTTYPLKIKLLNKPFGVDVPRPNNYFDLTTTKDQIIQAILEFKQWLNKTNLDFEVIR